MQTSDKPDLPLLAAIKPVSALLASVAILLLGNGLQTTLIPVRGNSEAFLPFELGALGAAYFVGFTTGCVHGPALVRRAGHIRTFLAMISLASVGALIHAMFVEPVLWCVLRAITGYCFAVLFIVAESWLNEAADNRTRGTVFSVYTIINLTVITAGQMMLALADPTEFVLFAVASILISLAALPIAFTKAASPAPIAIIRPNLKKLYRISPVGLAGCFVVGLALGPFWALGPVFAQNQGFDSAGIGLFMSAVVLGGAIAQWPLGRYSDRVDRRLVMVTASIIAIVAALGIMTLSREQQGLTLLLGAFFGAGAFPLYPLAVAHANDHADPADYVEVSSGLLLIYGIGAAVGPLIASAVRQLADTPNLFYTTAVIHSFLAIYVLYRVARRDPAAEADRVTFNEAAIAAQTVTPFEPPRAAQSP